MWPFKGKPVEKPVRDPFPEWPTKEVYREIGQLNENDAELRVWLPESCLLALKAFAEETDLSISDYVREFLVVFLYGELTLRRMCAEKTGIYFIPPPPPVPPLPPPPDPKEDVADSVPMPLFSRARKIETVPGLGKNMSPIKVFLPTQLKRDCENAAKLSKMPMSRLVREALIAQLLGHRILLERYGEWSASELKAAADWESGKTAPEMVNDYDPVPEGSSVVNGYY